MKQTTFKAIIGSQDVQSTLGNNLYNSAETIIRWCSENDIVLAIEPGRLTSIALWEVEDAFNVLSVERGPNFDMLVARQKRVLHDLFKWQQNHDDVAFDYHRNYIAGHNDCSATESTSYVISSGRHFYLVYGCHFYPADYDIRIPILIDDFFQISIITHLVTMALLGY